MSFHKFALVPYADYQVMVEHKCIEPNGSATQINDTPEGNIDQKHTVSVPVSTSKPHITPTPHNPPVISLPDLSEDIPLIHSGSSITNSKRVSRVGKSKKKKLLKPPMVVKPLK
jgi:hypothetical protein